MFNRTEPLQTLHYHYTRVHTRYCEAQPSTTYRAGDLVVDLKRYHSTYNAPYTYDAPSEDTIHHWIITSQGRVRIDGRRLAAR